MRKKIYLAGACFTAAERIFLCGLKTKLENNSDCAVLLPQEFVAALPDLSPTAIQAECLLHLKDATFVVAVLDGTDVDSGTAFELGSAFEMGKTIVTVRTDIRGTWVNEMFPKPIYIPAFMVVGDVYEHQIFETIAIAILTKLGVYE